MHCILFFKEMGGGAKGKEEFKLGVTNVMKRVSGALTLMTLSLVLFFGRRRQMGIKLRLGFGLNRSSCPLSRSSL
jgi:hypothetical protein